MLDAAQREELERSGVVRLPGALADAEVAAMRDALWGALATLHGARHDAPESWPEGRPSGFQKISRSEAFAAMRGEAVREAARDVLGPCAPQPVVNPLVNFPLPAPQASREWNLPHNAWHLDLPATALDLVPAMRVFGFLDRVEPRGGGTAVVLGSHRLIRQVVREKNPSGHLPSRRVRETLRRGQPWLRDLFAPGPAPERIRRFMEEGTEIDGIALRVEELTGEAGDVVLMDLRMLHTLTPNARQSPRLVLGSVVFRAA